MPSLSDKTDASSLGQVFWHLGFIAVGSLLCALAANGILIPQGFLTGGFAALAGPEVCSML